MGGHENLLIFIEVEFEEVFQFISIGITNTPGLLQHVHVYILHVSCIYKGFEVNE